MPENGRWDLIRRLKVILEEYVARIVDWDRESYSNHTTERRHVKESGLL